MDLILASTSPRRKELLELMNVPFSIKTEEVNEDFSEHLSPSEAVMFLADKKAKAVAKKTTGQCVIIGADTVVSIDGKILGKPKDEQEAYEMLSTLSGRTHEVYTGISINLCGTDKKIVRACCTKVFMDLMTPESIKQYIATGEPMDKAGAYGIQGRGALFIEKIEGDYYNVMGLSINVLKSMLLEVGYDVFENMK